MAKRKEGESVKDWKARVASELEKMKTPAAKARAKVLIEHRKMRGATNFKKKKFSI